VKVGDLVRYIGPSLFDKPAPIGTVARMPLDDPNPLRADDSRVLVDGMGVKSRPRPVRPEHLEVIS
jgi:hypothetical protein